MEYKLTLVDIPRNGQRWVIQGLPEDKEVCRLMRVKPQEDTTLWAVGMHEANDSVESIVRGVYAAIYDLYQVSETLKEGDIIKADACVARKFLDYDWSKCDPNNVYSQYKHRHLQETFQIPAIEIHLVDVHAVLVTPKVADVITYKN